MLSFANESVLKRDRLAWHRLLRLGTRMSTLTPGFDAAQGKRGDYDLDRWRFAGEIVEVILTTPSDWSARIGTTIADRPSTDPYKRVYAYGSYCG
jgi:hypothetical protein